VNSLADAARTIAARPELVPGVLSVVLLGVTEFFRDREVFEQLRLRALPQLVSLEKHLRIWSAACSEGHELYSVAMLLEETGYLDRCELLGTDCRSEAIEQARQGVFVHEALNRVAPACRQRYFTMRGAAAAIDWNLRIRPSWRVADLFERVEPGPWHLILWRNMAIYLAADAAETLWSRICDELAPGGFLVTGKADYPPTRLPLRRVSACLYQKWDA
jgi:chemotaxis methyl-accepting protein methylase